MMSVIYKLMAKMIALRMTPSLAEIVSPHQHGFIKERSIYDNILVVMLGMEYTQFTKQECILLQLDLDKAYDQISWSFIQDALKSFGFGPRICNLIQAMGDGSSAKLLFNALIVGGFQLKRSICQGCPLDPLLFATCYHPLIVFLEQAAAKQEITGLKLPNGEQLLAKMFADDTLLFLQAKHKNVKRALELV